MAPEGWRSPEFEPDRRRRVRMVPLPGALVAGCAVVFVVAAMVSVASRAFFAPMVKERNPVEIAESTPPSVPVGTPTTPSTSVLPVDPSTPPPTSPVDPAAPDPTEPTTSLPPSSSSPVPPPSPPPSVVPVRPTTTTTTPASTVPDDPTPPTTEPSLPLASRSESQCPVISVAVTADRATVLVVNLRSTESVIVLNGQSLTLAPDGCRTVTVDAAMADPAVAGDVIEVTEVEPGCTTRLEGELIASATSYELQVADGSAACADAVSAEVTIFEAQLWRSASETGHPNDTAPTLVA